jgi:hypothetical protein
MPHPNARATQSAAIFSSPTSSGSALQTILVILAAIAVAAVGIASFVYFGEKPVKPSGQVEQIWVYPIHRESKFGGGGAGQAPGVAQDFDQLFVIAKVKIDNPGKIPIFVRDMSAVVTLPQDVTQTSQAAGRSDFNQIFAAYPETAEHKDAPLLRDTSIAPGTSAEGLLVFNYTLTKEQWNTHTALDVTISFVHQADIILKSPQS